MKISLNQPNGFPTIYGPDSNKYIDMTAPSTPHLIIRHRKQKKSFQSILTKLWYSCGSGWV